MFSLDLISLKVGAFVGPGDVGPHGVWNICTFIASINSSSNPRSVSPITKGSSSTPSTFKNIFPLQPKKNIDRKSVV